MKILITGGPVYAHLDAVKIITNKFRGGRMAQLADILLDRAYGVEGGLHIIYLTARGYAIPNDRNPNIEMVYHDGYDDYKKKVLELAPECDAVVLGAAVCNLIPAKPWKEKFPSHQYTEGDTIPIPFKIAPRIINMVKKVAPKTTLFGFKLLKGVPHGELIEAAYEVVTDSGAACVFANDADDLDTKFAVTKERSVHALVGDWFVDFLWNMIWDKYYSTVIENRKQPPIRVRDIACILRKRYASKFKATYGKNKLVFGTIAVRLKEGENPFLVTSRGKKEFEDWTVVRGVNHLNREVYVSGKKASLNAPLLDTLFTNNQDVFAIVHFHESLPGLPMKQWAPPGTVRDSLRTDIRNSFVIDSHGTFLLLKRGDCP